MTWQIEVEVAAVEAEAAFNNRASPAVVAEMAEETVDVAVEAQVILQGHHEQAHLLFSSMCPHAE